MVEQEGKINLPPTRLKNLSERGKRVRASNSRESKMRAVLRKGGNGMDLARVNSNIVRLANKLRNDRVEIIQRNPNREIVPLSVKDSLLVAESRLAEKAYH